MDKYERSKVDKLISRLDTAAGMLLVAAMKDGTVKDAMEIVSQVSFDLGNMLD